MPFDRERYEREVLEPARARGNEPPEDLAVRYALTPDLLRSAGLGGHLDEVAAHWDALKRSRKYARLAEALLIAHATLQRADGLSRAAIEQRRRALEQRLGRRVEDVAAAASCVSPRGLERLAESSGLGAAAVRSALSTRGVRVVEPPELVPEPAKYRDVQRHVRALGLRLSVEVVFGDRVRRGFRLLNGFALETGERLDAARIAAARGRLDSARLDDRKTAAANVLTILDGLARNPDAVRALLLTELVEAMRRTPVLPPSQRALAREAIELGLRQDEAAALALAVAEAGLGEQADQRHEATEAAARRVAELVAEADRALVAGRDEDAAVALAEAARLAEDDEEPARRLRAIPPPPPTDLRLSVESGGVAVRWRASAARTGTVLYRVVRGGREVAATEGNEAMDPDVPPGQPLTYQVFASRGDRSVWSAPATAGPVLVAPDVTELQLHADGRSVTGAWRAHPDTAEVVVVGSEHGPPRTRTDGRLIRQVTLLGFTDADVRADATYHYRVVAVYRGPDGTRQFSPGLVASITPELAPSPVTDLSVATPANRAPSVLQATWTTPPRGAVTLWLAEAPPAWPPGTVVSLGELSALGRQLPGTPEPLRDGRASMELVAAELHARAYVTVVTQGRTRAAVGSTVHVTLAPPVSDLTAQRFGDLVRLSWVWPPRSQVATVAWSSNAVEWSRRRYEDQGGCEIAVGPGATTIAVRAVTREPAGDVEAPPVEVVVEALAPAVRYELRGGGLRRRRRTLVVRAEIPCDLPRLVLVRRPGPVLPLRPDQGTEVAHVPARRLEPAWPVTVEVDLPPGPAWLRLFAEDAAMVRLVDPPADQLEVR